jgi:ribA/ribD-fused uncharacterized protein
MPIRFYTPKYYVFNNFSAHAIEYEGKLYPTSEHAYQAAKCTEPRGLEEIRNARSPLQAKILANETYGAARDPDWEGKKVGILEAILRAKLAQHPEAQEALSQSGQEEIVEDSPTRLLLG